MAETLPIRPRTTGTAPPTVPLPPANLTVESARIWAAINAQWVLDAAALPLLAAGLECRDRYRAAAEQIERDGPTVMVAGSLRTHPAHPVARDNLREFRQIWRQLNLEIEEGA
jgi:hypothetical protein